MIDMNKVLDVAIAKDASDIHLVPGNKPMLRISRRLEPVEKTEELTEDDMMEIYDYLVKGNVEADEQYKEIFKYSSMEEYLKIFNEYSATPVIEELKSLPQDYVFNMSIPFSELLNYDVLSLVVLYKLNNTLSSFKLKIG